MDNVNTHTIKLNFKETGYLQRRQQYQAPITDYLFPTSGNILSYIIIIVALVMFILCLILGTTWIVRTRIKRQRAKHGSGSVIDENFGRYRSKYYAKKLSNSNSNSLFRVITNSLSRKTSRGSRHQQLEACRLSPLPSFMIKNGNLHKLKNRDILYKQMQVVGMVPAAKRVISGGIRSDIKEISAGIATDGNSNRNSTSSDIGSSNRINDNTLELGTKNGQQQEYTDTSPLTPSHKKDKKGKAVVMYSPHYNQILFSDDYTSPEPCYEFENMVELKILRNASIFPPSDDHHLIQHEMEGETQL